MPVSTRYVCTADRQRRHSCGEECEGCNYLIAERRNFSHSQISSAPLFRLNFPERRIMSHILPWSDFSLAGTPGAVVVPRWSTRRLPSAIMALLIVFNLFDVVLTLRALSLGVAEANPVMAGLFGVSLPLGMLVKFIAVSAGAVLLWRYRHLPLATRGMNILAFAYGAVVAYHVIFQLGTF